MQFEWAANLLIFSFLLKALNCAFREAILERFLIGFTDVDGADEEFDEDKDIVDPASPTEDNAGMNWFPTAAPLLLPSMPLVVACGETAAMSRMLTSIFIL